MCDAFVGNTGHSDSEIDLACTESSESTVLVRGVQFVLERCGSVKSGVAAVSPTPEERNLRQKDDDPQTDQMTKETTRIPGWHPEEKEAQLPQKKGTLLPAWVLHQGEGPQQPQCVKGNGPKDPGVAAPLAAAGCCGNCYFDTGGRSHASARSSSSSHFQSSGPWS